MVVFIMLIGAGLAYWLVGLLYARYWNKGLTARIQFSTNHAVKGDKIELIETVANKKYLPLPYIYVKFQVDKSMQFLGEDGSFSVSDKAYRNDVFSLLHYQQAVRRIPVRCTKRGVYSIDDVSIISTGAFMGDILAENLKQNAVITVYPKPADTKRLSVPFQQMMGTIERNRYLYEDKFIFRGIREYQSYDSMNQVNWMATAKSGRLMVNQYNESVCRQVCILLNLEPEGMIFQEKLSEESISISSGLAQMFIEQGVSVSLLSNGKSSLTNEEITVYGGSGQSHLNNINEVLAAVDLKLPVREFNLILTEMHTGIYGQEYRTYNNNANMTYIIISQNRRENIMDNFRTLCGNFAGTWIVPCFVDEMVYKYREQNTFKSDFAENINFETWEVNRND